MGQSISEFTMVIVKAFYVLLLVIQKTYGYDFFGTKTSYFVAANTDESPIELDGCQPRLFWNLARHGTRNPGDDDILEMNEKLPGIRSLIVEKWEEGLGYMEEEDIIRLVDWELNLSVEDDSLLTESGSQKHREMGARWAQRLPDLIENFKNIEIRSSSKERCVESGRSFVEGMLPSGEIADIVEDNKFLRFYDYCKKFNEEVEENEETFSESNKFKSSIFFKEMLDRVSLKTGIILDESQVSLMWEICRYEDAWYPLNDSPWCSVFTVEDFKLYEFFEDLKYYYNDGAAYNITSEMTQPLFSDLFNKIHEIEGSDKESQIVLNFAHSETVQPFITALGLYRDSEDILASDWATPKEPHLWQVSKVAPFATNIGIVLFHCDVEVEDLPEWKVSVFHNEFPVVEGLSLDNFKEAYKQFSDLDFDKVCEN